MTEIAPQEPPADPDSERDRLLRATLCGATLVMVGLSWPLWIDLADFPAVPLVRGYPAYPREWSWVGLAAIVGGCGLGMSRRFGRLGVGLTAVVMAWMVLGDQLRLQPWVYQFLVMGTLLAILPPGSAMAFGRIYMVSVYLHSGLSKLDTPFAQEMGPLFLRTFARVCRFDASGLLRPGREACVLAMPAGEIVVAILLLFRPTRAVGLLGLLAIHAALLVILGPWGLGHSTIVLIWNVALAAEECLLFWPPGRSGFLPMRWTARVVLIGVPFAIVLVMPLFERLGLYDSWPSHALYASHCERSRIEFGAWRSERQPLAVRAASSPHGAGWSLNPTDWTRAVRGVPVYPQRRYLNGLAEWLAGLEGFRFDRVPVTVVHDLRADPRTGRREVIRRDGLDEIRDEGDLFWFNAHPRPPRKP